MAVTYRGGANSWCWVLDGSIGLTGESVRMLSRMDWPCNTDTRMDEVTKATCDDNIFSVMMQILCVEYNADYKVNGMDDGYTLK